MNIVFVVVVVVVVVDVVAVVVVPSIGDDDLNLNYEKSSQM